MTNPIIPAPNGGHRGFFVAEKPFEVGPELTVYQAAMVYADRHPCERILGVGSDYPPNSDDYLAFLRGGMERRTEAQQSWDIWCELVKRIETGEIKPVRCHYERSRKIDFVHTVIRLVDLAKLATERGEHPDYLRHVQEKSEGGISKPAARTLRHAPPEKINQAIETAYDDADAAGKKPPNIKELATVVQPRLESMGYTVSKSQIMKRGKAFKDRRRPPGPTVRSEQQQLETPVSAQRRTRKRGHA